MDALYKSTFTLLYIPLHSLHVYFHHLSPFSLSLPTQNPHFPQLISTTVTNHRSSRQIIQFPSCSSYFVRFSVLFVFINLSVPVLLSSVIVICFSCLSFCPSSFTGRFLLVNVLLLSLCFFKLIS